MWRAQLLNYSLSSSITDNEYIDTDSDGNSYRTEPTVFDSDADGDTNSNAHSNADSNAHSDADNDAYSDADSTAESENIYEASAQV